MRTLTLMILLAVTVGSEGARVSAPTECSVLALQQKAPPGTTITAAAVVAAEGTTPEYCRVDGHAATPGNTVNFRLGLPLAWNGKFFFEGVGGFAGTIGPLNAGLEKGYASASTDTGHQGSVIDASWALNSPAKRIDYAYRGTHGNWVTSWGTRGPSGPQADQNPSQFNTLHNIGVDRQNNVYVADRNNRRIQVFDRSGRFLRFIHLNVAYDKTRHPVLGNVPATRPDQTQPWTLCITNTPTQYLYTSDEEPGRIYKMTLDGKVLGWIGESGRGPRQFNWIHGLACPSENELLVADMRSSCPGANSRGRPASPAQRPIQYVNALPTSDPTVAMSGNTQKTSPYVEAR